MPERPDFERVLAEHHRVGGTHWDHERKTTFTKCQCGGRGYLVKGPSFDTHLAAALNSEVYRWLADEGTRERVADAFSHTGVNRPQGFTVPEWRNELATAALTALAPTDTPADEGGARCRFGNTRHDCADDCLGDAAVDRWNDRTEHWYCPRGNDNCAAHPTTADEKGAGR